MKLSKLYKITEMNSFQYLALTGLVMSAAANIILFLFAKQIDHFWALYICWLVVFVLGSISNLNSKPDKDHHHH